MKTCSKCGEAKALDLFFKDKGFKDGHSSICKVCKKAATARWRDKNRESWNEYMRRYNAEHPLSKKERLQIRHRILRHRYGLAVNEYNERLSAQEGRCLICRRLASDIGRDLVVDHCHRTKKVRGLLCFSCNRSIAIFDEPVLLERAMAYLAQ